MFVVYRILGWHFSFDTLKISLYCALALIKVGSHPYLCSSLYIVVSSPPSPCLPLQLIFYLSLVLFNNLIVMYPDVTFFVFHLWLLGLLMFSGLEYLSNLDIFQPLRPQIFFFFWSPSSLLDSNHLYFRLLGTVSLQWCFAQVVLTFFHFVHFIWTYIFFLWCLRYW